MTKHPQITDPRTGQTFDMQPGMYYEYSTDGALTGHNAQHIQHLEKDLEYALKQIALLSEKVAKLENKVPHLTAEFVDDGQGNTRKPNPHIFGGAMGV